MQPAVSHRGVSAVREVNDEDVRDEDEKRRLRMQLVEKEGQLKMLRDKNSVLDRELFDLKKAIHAQQQLSQGMAAAAAGGETVDRVRRLSGSSIELAAELDRLKSEVHFKDEEAAELKERLRDVSDRNARMERTGADADVAMEELRTALELERGEASKLRENMQLMRMEMQQAATTSTMSHSQDNARGTPLLRHPPTLHVLCDECGVHMHALLLASGVRTGESASSSASASTTAAALAPAPAVKAVMERVRHALAVMTVCDAGVSEDDVGSPSDTANVEMSKALAQCVTESARWLAAVESSGDTSAATVTHLLCASVSVLSTLIVHSAPAREALLQDLSARDGGTSGGGARCGAVALLGNLVVATHGTLKPTCSDEAVFAFVQLLSALSVCLPPDDLLAIIDTSGVNLVWGGALAQLIAYAGTKDSDIVEDIRRESLHLLLVIVHVDAVLSWLNSDNHGGNVDGVGCVDGAGDDLRDGAVEHGRGPSYASSVTMLKALSSSLRPLRSAARNAGVPATRGLELASLSVECLAYIAARMRDTAIAKLFETGGSSVVKNVFGLVDEICGRLVGMDADVDGIGIEMLLRLLADLLNLMTVGFGSRITDPGWASHACTPDAGGVGSSDGVGISAPDMMRSIAGASECVRDLRFTRRRCPMPSASTTSTSSCSALLDRLCDESSDALDWLLGQVLSSVFSL